MHKSIVSTIAFVLLVIGGLNWGLVALGYNVVDMLGSTLATIVYALVGLSALWMIYVMVKKK